MTRIPLQVVVAMTSVDSVVAGSTEYAIGTRAGNDGVVAAVPEDRVVAAVAKHVVVSPAPKEMIIAWSAIDDVVINAAPDDIVATETECGLRTIAPEADEVMALGALNDIVRGHD
jgi:hypothetical protein